MAREVVVKEKKGRKNEACWLLVDSRGTPFESLVSGRVKDIAE